MLFNPVEQIHLKLSACIIYYQIIVLHLDPVKIISHIIHIFQLIILFN